MKRLLAITTIVALCSVLSFVVAYAAESTQATKGTWNGTTNLGDLNGRGCLLGAVAYVTAQGTGVASPWGASTWEGHGTCMYPQVPVFGPIDGKMVFQGLGFATITAANGDEIELELVFTLIGNPLADDQGQWNQDVLVIGGTGRFENAVGHAFSGGVWTNEGSGNLSWEGTHAGTIIYEN